MPTIADALLREAESYIHKQIPITTAMGVRLAGYDVRADQLLLTAPLEANHNHLGTAFGGSLSALCTLAGYALLWLELGRRNREKAHIVVRESAISYKKPVRGKLIEVACQRPAADIMSAFQEQFAKRDRASVQLACTVTEAKQVCVEFAGSYVAIL